MMINKKSMLHLVGMLFYVCGTWRLGDVRLEDVRVQISGFRFLISAL